MNNLNFIYRPFIIGEENSVSSLVWEVFAEFEAPDYSKEGIDTFKDFIEPKNLLDKIQNEGYKIYCCFDENTIVGVIAMRMNTHISLLFVKKNYHRQGIARKLLKLAIEHINRSDAAFLTVNSSPYAEEIYEKLGFIPTDQLQEKDGLKYIPMKYEYMV